MANDNQSGQIEEELRLERERLELERRARETMKSYSPCPSKYKQEYQPDELCSLQSGHKGPHKTHRGFSWTGKQVCVARVRTAAENIARAFTELFSAMLPEDDE